MELTLDRLTKQFGARIAVDRVAFAGGTPRRDQPGRTEGSSTVRSRFHQ